MAGAKNARSLSATEQQALQGQFRSNSPLAETAIARDLENYADDESSALTTDDDASETSTIRAMNSHTGTNPHSLAGSYQRPSFFTTVSHATVVPHRAEHEGLTRREREQAIEDERDLLSDNNFVGSAGPRKERRSQDSGARPVETTSLLGSRRGSSHPNVEDADEIDRKWEEAVMAGLIHTTWKREAQVIGKNAAPLVVTFLLQYSLTVASIFTLGHLGKKELGAVSLASMTANITGYAVYQGLATSLDTLCAQAYGSGRKKLVGLQMQKMVFFLWVISVPIVVLWFFGDRVLLRIVPETEVAQLAGLYLKVVALGAPGYACFESGKRYVQAQGLFSASLAFRNWGPMVRLALPGLIMVEAECLAFEILTLASSYLGTTPLAAQSILSTISSITFQIPFPLSISGSTRVANLIGATLVDAAKTSAKVTMVGAVIVGLLNMLFLSSLRDYIPRLFTSDDEVVELVAQVLPLCAAFQLFDALAANCNGILRGIGRQEIGGYVQLFCYYAIAMPISFGTTFALGWGLFGLWSGVALALLLVSIIEAIFLRQTNWDRSVEDALERNAAT
ncbi:hypothetical protein N8T08_009345 [Aspergillus melleus]|uniref:Uncharacterized protein n=1 Tax=Aspergillus melleus TaxID=138277 RepID=A0ACC3ATL7_9EURO|nr:hypothetical protein N8T08_009345 [Aspergillus melleus]